MRNLAAVALLIAAFVASFAVIEHTRLLELSWLPNRSGACEPPREVWRLSLGELKENGVIRKTEKKLYEPWFVSLSRHEADLLVLLACRNEAMTLDCYTQKYRRRFGTVLAGGGN